jgi:hypothetical protein
MNHPSPAATFGVVSLALWLAAPAVGWAAIPAISSSAAADPTLKHAVYVCGSGTTDLVFRYVVADGDLDLYGVQLLPSAPSGGSIRAANGLTASSSALPVRHFASGIIIVARPTAGVAGNAAAVQSVAMQP